MGNTDTKLNFRKAVIQLTSKTQPIDSGDDAFWDQFWNENVQSVQDVFTLVPAAEIRALREEAPANLATLCYKAVEKMVRAVDNSCRTQQEQMTVLNCVRLLARVLPYIFEDPEWQGFFWTSLPDGSAQKGEKDESTPLAHSLLNAVSDLLFCPDFTVASKRTGPDKAEDLQSIDSCEYIWEAGVGFAQSPPHYSQYDSSRTELLKLLLTCFSETMYHPPTDLSTAPNKWVQYFTSSENRHALPIFTSLLNTVCAYDPVGLGLPYNHLLFSDSWEPLVDVALQILIVALDHDVTTSSVYDVSMCCHFRAPSASMLDPLIKALKELQQDTYILMRSQMQRKVDKESYLWEKMASLTTGAITTMEFVKAVSLKCLPLV
ncbi:hypothetical protein GE061_007632 [Apolygus lucorum]|uniref:Protein HID1 n=1 Tax=Apolygus lucorum TaxID=248454 RepID=A0A8S9WKZ1_APOLU|nr:hypothetical protein GE061_007632 [Apolygus lucorum]